jgi:NAD(P)-dependent dehydrogenase (short-subunit alcohol dehydrogenase family)
LTWCDHLDPDQVKGLAEQIRNDHGHLDLLVNDIWGGELLKGGPTRVRVYRRRWLTQLLDLLMLCGWYDAVRFAANGARVALKPRAARIADITDPPSSPAERRGRRR